MKLTDAISDKEIILKIKYIDLIFGFMYGFLISILMMFHEPFLSSL